MFSNFRYIIALMSIGCFLLLFCFLTDSSFRAKSSKYEDVSIVFPIEIETLRPHSLKSPETNCFLPKAASSLLGQNLGKLKWEKIVEALNDRNISGVPFSSLPNESKEALNWRVSTFRSIRCGRVDVFGDCLPEARWVVQPFIYDKGKVSYIADAALHLIWAPLDFGASIQAVQHLKDLTKPYHLLRSDNQRLPLPSSQLRQWDCAAANTDKVERILTEFSESHELKFIDWMTSNHTQMKWAFGSLKMIDGNWKSQILPSKKIVELIDLNDFSYNADNIRKSVLRDSVNINDPLLFFGSSHSRRDEISCVGCHLYNSLYFNRQLDLLRNRTNFDMSAETSSGFNLRHFSYRPDLDLVVSTRLLFEIGVFKVFEKSAP